MTIAMLALLGACGSATDGDDDDDDDNIGADAGPDVDDPDADTTPAIGECSVKRLGAPTMVVFHDADGLPLATKTTGAADGIARYDACVDGGMVTIYNPLFLGGGGGTSSKLVTVQDVRVGDMVVFDPPTPTPSLQGPMEVSFSNADDTVSLSPDHYDASLGKCMGSFAAIAGDNGDTLDIANIKDCAGNDPTDLAVVSVARSALGEPRGLARVDITDLTAPVSGGGGEWVHYGGPALFGFHNWPAGTQGAFSVLSPVIDGVTYGLDFGGVEPGSETMSRHVWPAAIADGHRITFSTSFANGYASSTRQRLDGAPALNIDLADFMFAQINGIVLNVADKARPKYTWQDGDDRAVYARAEFIWTDGAHTGTWIVIANGNTRDIQAPALPDELVEAAPQATALVNGSDLLLVDKEIPYAQWLEEGLDTRSSAETISPHEISQYIEQDNQVIRLTAYFAQD